MKNKMTEEIRAAGKAAIINQKGEILVIKRSDSETHLENFWDVPGGRFDYGETPHQGLKRETKEECGLEIEIVEPINSWSFMRDDGQQIFGTTFFCSPETEEVKLGDEHTDYQWINREELENIEMHQDLKESLKSNLG